jgi:hypothetical protein
MAKPPGKFFVPVLIVLLALGLWIVWINHRAEQFQPTEITAADRAPAASPLPSFAPAARTLTARATPTPSPTFAPPDEPAMIEVDKVNLMLRDYRTLAGENPVGTNAEIMAAVMGKNPKQARLGPPEGMQLNEKGELIDRYGTPYFFHQLSRDHMEIRSAGADRVMWTDDDAVIK